MCATLQPPILFQYTTSPHIQQQRKKIGGLTLGSLLSLALASLMISVLEGETSVTRCIITHLNQRSHTLCCFTQHFALNRNL